MTQNSLVPEASSPADSPPPYRVLLFKLLPILGTLLLILLTVSVAAVAARVSPVTSLLALWQGAFGNAYALSETLTRTIPLLFTGLGVALAFRCGVWNIGAEGQFLVGAMAAMAVLKVWQPASPWIGIPALLLVGAGAGAAWALIPALLLLYRRVPEVISTIMLNFVALNLLGWSIRGPLQESIRQFPQSDEVPAALHLWRFLPPTRLHLGLLIAFGAMIAFYFFLFYTIPGFQIRATGQNSQAAQYAGIPVARVIGTAMGLGGAVAGLGGAVELMGVTFRLYEPFSPGYGYTAIAVALLGGLHPLFVGGAALLFGALDAGSGSLQGAAGIPSVLVSALQAMVLFFVAWQNARTRR